MTNLDKNLAETAQEIDYGKIQFMSNKVRFATLSLSIFLVVASIVGLFWKGLNLGVDFTGGTVIEVSYPTGVDLPPIRNSLEEAGFISPQVQHFGSSKDVLIRIAPIENMASATLSNEVMKTLREQANTEIELRRVEFVGPQVGEELTTGGALAVLYAMFGILIYVGLRFEFRLSAGAVIALTHDVIIAVGFFAWSQIEFDLTVVAAILAIIGYSINDTIVVFDRIRENFRKMREVEPVNIVNKALNEMLARTLMTSLTTLVVLIALFAVGGESLTGFSVALMIGVVVGTYSSIYIASNVALLMGVSKQDLMPAAKTAVDREKTEEAIQQEFLEAESKRKLQD